MEAGETKSRVGSTRHEGRPEPPQGSWIGERSQEANETGILDDPPPQSGPRH